MCSLPCFALHEHDLSFMCLRLLCTKIMNKQDVMGRLRNIHKSHTSKLINKQAASALDGQFVCSTVST